jgi:hypothetical protein
MDNQRVRISRASEIGKSANSRDILVAKIKMRTDLWHLATGAIMFPRAHPHTTFNFGAARQLLFRNNHFTSERSGDVAFRHARLYVAFS